MKLLSQNLLSSKKGWTGVALLSFALWWGAYSQIDALAHWLVFSAFGVSEQTALGSSLSFFFYDTAKILLLLVLMVYVLGWLRAGLHTERVRDFLAGKGRGVGYLLGAGFGAVTPFCSCSSIPLFLGFTMARIPIGVTMSFLITSPIINEIAVVLLWGLLGWKFTAVYVLIGLGCGIIGGMFMDWVRAERWLQPLAQEAFAFASSASEASTAEESASGMYAQRHEPVGLAQRHAFAKSETVGIFRRVWLWVVVGVGVGAVLHGFVPQEWFADNLGAGQWWSVPLAAAAGIPLYTNVTGIIPVMESLLMKGLPVGTTLAFCMSTVAVSLPEMLMLKQVMRWKLLAYFFGLLLVLFTLVGWIFNALQAYIF